MQHPSTTPTDSTAALVASAQEGDDDAYDRLLTLAHARARLFVRMRLGPALRTKLDSQDVLQDAYLEAHRAFDAFEYRGPGSFTRWLCRIIENRIRGLADHFGAQKRRPPPGDARISRVQHFLEASAAGPRTVADRREESERLVSACDQLAADQREVLLLRFFQDRSIDEIASLTQRSPTTTRRLLGRAAVALGSLLEQAP